MSQILKKSLLIVCTIGLKDLGKNTPIELEKLLNFPKQCQKNSLENIREYIFKAIKDNIERKIYLYPNIVTYVDETPIVLKPITGIIIEKKDKNQLQFIPLVNVKKEYLVFYIY